MPRPSLLLSRATRGRVLEALRRVGPAQGIPVNVYETDDAVVIVAPCPAVRPDDILIELTGNELSIEARLRTVAPKRYFQREWAYGGYERVLVLPRTAGLPATAVLGNGQLVIRLALGEATEHAVIPVSAH